MGASFFPLDEALGLLPGKWSPRIQQVVVRLGSMVPFGQVPPILQMVGRVSVSRASVQRLTETAGDALVHAEQAAAERITRDLPPDPVGARCQQVSVDGAMVPIVGGEWREVKTMVIGELSNGDGHARQLSYVARIAPLEAFVQVTTAELHRRGTFAAETVVAVVDGAAWCQQVYDYHLPHAVRILDYPHAVEQLTRAAQACFGPGVAADDWLRTQCTELREGSAAAVCQAVSQLPVTHASDPTEAYRVMRQVEGYLRTRLAHLAYATFLAQGYPIGSGIVESANKVVVEARLKGAGMHWTVAHANALLALRGMLCSQRWEEGWAQVVQQRTVQRRQRPIGDPCPEHPAPVRGKRPSLRTTLAKLGGANPYFTNGKPNASHPYKKDYARKYGTTDRAASQPSTKL